MGALDELTPEVRRLLAGKEARRHALAALPFPEKVRTVAEAAGDGAADPAGSRQRGALLANLRAR
ncbi:hypothetical protein BH20VER2_BH20VER2_17370 [soil metagenome]